MITSRYDWQLLPSVTDETFLKEAKKEQIDQRVAQLLYERGVQSKEDLHRFLHPQLEKLYDPYLLHDMDKAVDRIRRAIENGEQILIYGDYDADGMTSAAIVKETLDGLGAESLVYLPNRFTDGYGPNQSVYKYFIEHHQVSLIVTVDNGVAGHEAIVYAQEQGVDVVVTDHHSLPTTLPQAYAIVHPEHPAAAYPFPHLAGCGVAFKLACALLETIPMDLLDLVAIGTVADMVSLTDENRILVFHGLTLLKTTERVGLQELLQLSGVDISQINEETIGFQIAPRLNALGRLDDPNPAVELLTGFDEDELHAIAVMIEEKNKERKEVVQAIYAEAKEQINPNKPVQVLAKEGWNPGVLGIVAGQLLEEFGRPVVVLSIEDGRAKGSARSIEAVHLFDALAEHKELFIAFGGHAGAAGMTLTTDNLSALSDALEDYIVSHQIDCSQKNSLVLDEELHLEEVTIEVVKSYDRLAPYGMNHAKPVFYLKDFEVVSARTMGQDNAHLKLRIQQGQAQVDVIAFGQGQYAVEYSQATELELAVTLSVNQWNGTTSLQLMLVDARVQGVQLYNIRGKQTPLPAGVPVLDVQQLPQSKTIPVIVLDELPEDMTVVRKWFKEREFQAVYFKNHLPSAYYLTGYGTREQFAKLYKAVAQFETIDVRHKLTELAAYLNIPQLLLVKMIQIFQELGFVTIVDGVLTVVKDAAKRPISDSLLYQQLKITVKEQELLALGSVQEIYQWLKEE